MDFVELRKAIKGLVERLDHRFLNDLAPFDKLNPWRKTSPSIFTISWNRKSGIGGCNFRR